MFPRPRSSLQNYFIGMILGTTILLTGIMGLLNLRFINVYSTRLANMGLNLETQKTAANLNKPLLQVSDAVNFMASIMRQHYDRPDQIRDPQLRQAVDQRLYKRFVTAVNTIPEVSGFYIHYNENLTGEPRGFWYRKAENSGDFHPEPITNVEQAKKGQTVPIQWYTAPKEQQQAMWIPPYKPNHTDIWMVSYVKPVYLRHQFIGVVGINISMSTLISMVQKVSVYDSGYGALLSPTGRVYAHPDVNILTDDDATIQDLGLQIDTIQLHHYDSGDKTIPVIYKGQKKKIAFTTLENGMKLGVSAPDDEIYAAQRQAIFRFLFLIVLFGIGTSALAIHLTRRVLAPLKDINLAARRMGRGNYDTLVEKRYDDEIGQLADDMNATMGQMKDMVHELRRQAHYDKLTGVKNTSAFEEKLLQLDQQIQDGSCPPFSLVLVDMNELKTINDTYGHEKGNLAIQAMVKTICDLYKHSPVYRIGGDEFLVVVQNDDFDNQDTIWRQLVPYLRHRTRNFNEPWLERSFSAGRSQYRPGVDKSCKEVFRRADAAMYKVKKAIEQDR